jgi:hypothetical protein
VHSIKKPLHSSAEGVSPDLDSMLAAPAKTAESAVVSAATAIVVQFSIGGAQYLGLLTAFSETKEKLKLSITMDQAKVFGALRAGALLTDVETTAMPSGTVKKLGAGTIKKLRMVGMQGKLVMVVVSLIRV